MVLCAAVDAEQLLNYSDATEMVQFWIGRLGSVNSARTNTIPRLNATVNIATIARAEVEQKKWVSAEQALPVYLRDNAWKKIPEQIKA